MHAHVFSSSLVFAFSFSLVNINVRETGCRPWRDLLRSEVLMCPPLHLSLQSFVIELTSNTIRYLKLGSDVAGELRCRALPSLAEARAEMIGAECINSTSRVAISPRFRQPTFPQTGAEIAASSEVTDCWYPRAHLASL
jgi:hypothetical protein